MQQGIHHHYERLTGQETEFVDAVFSDIYQTARQYAVPLAGDDRLERAVDALARAVIESRV
jgi:hypothetical protein